MMGFLASNWDWILSLVGGVGVDRYVFPYVGRKWKAFRAG